MPLQRDPATGKISRNLAGTLACSPSDCCDSLPCPSCCIRITSGALIDGQIKIFSYDGDNSLEITITTETGTRTVCDQEEIQIEIVYKVNGEIASVPVNALVTFDPAWDYVSSQPSGASIGDGIGGYVSWTGIIPNATPLDSLGVTLALDVCYLNFSTLSFGAIVINVAGIEEIIALEQCDPATYCCTYSVVCQPCCIALAFDPANNRVDPSAWVWREIGARFEKVAVVASGDFLAYVILWVKPATDSEANELALWCLDEEEVWDFGIELYPGNPLSTDFTGVEVTVDVCDFEIQLPLDPAWGEVDLVGGSQVINWPPSEMPDRPPTDTYSWSLKRACFANGCLNIPVTISFPDVMEAIEMLISFYDCGGEDCCDCCCDCYLGNATVTDLDITDGGTRWRLIAPVSLANNPSDPCKWILGVFEHGNPGNTGTVALDYCETDVGWRLQGFNSMTDWIRNTEPGPCSGEIPVTKPGATGFITIEGGVPCPGVV